MFKKLFLVLGFRNSWNYQKNRWLLFTNVALILLATYGTLSHYWVTRQNPAAVNLTQIAVQPRSPETIIEKFEGEIRKNMTLSDVLSSYNLSQDMIQQLVAVTKPIYNLKKLIVGNRFELEKLPDGTLKTFSYAVDQEKYVEVSLTNSGYKAEMKPFEYESREELIAGTIKNSLFQTMSDLEEGEQLALDLAEAFSYDIDFNTELHPGDHFKVAVEKHYQDGEFIKYGKIQAAEFRNKGKVFSAFLFADSAGNSNYYDASGRLLKRGLLKSPLKFSRVSSTFTRKRFHPVLGVFRPHLGVDYAAPTGTPVYSAGDGRVHFAGWKNGFGRFIQVNHNGEYCTMYGHLSKLAIGIRSGVSVRQGQLIGYVGATGLATGPHLDYRMTRRGVFINPLSVKFQPSLPLRSEHLLAFEARKLEWQQQLARLDFKKGTETTVSLSSTLPLISTVVSSSAVKN